VWWCCCSECCSYCCAATVAQPLLCSYCCVVEEKSEESKVRWAALLQPLLYVTVLSEQGGRAVATVSGCLFMHELDLCM
jgi:hypothetical protein